MTTTGTAGFGRAGRRRRWRAAWTALGDRLVVDVVELLAAGEPQARRSQGRQHDERDEQQEHGRAADQHLAVDARHRRWAGAQPQRLGWTSGSGGAFGPCDGHRLRLPPHGIGAHDADDALRRRAEPQLGGGEQAVDDVGGAPHPVVDERRLAVGADHEQGRRLALGQSRRELDVDLGAVVEHLARLPRRVALDAVTELQLLDVDAHVSDRAGGGLGIGALLLERNQLGGRIGPGHRRHVGLVRGAQLQVVGAAVGGDEKIGLQIRAEGLHQDVDDRLLALAAGGVTDDPAHRVAGRHRDELLAGLERDVGHLVDGGIDLVERALGVGIDLDGIDVAVLGGLDAGVGIGDGHALLWSLVVLRLLTLLRNRLELSRQRQRFWHLDVLDGRLGFGLLPGGLEREAVENRNLRHLDAGGAGTNDQREHRCRANGAQRHHLGSPAVTSCDQLKVCT